MILDWFFGDDEHDCKRAACPNTGFVPGDCVPGCLHWDDRYDAIDDNTAIGVSTVGCTGCGEFKLVIDGKCQCVNGACPIDLSRDDLESYDSPLGG